jgi:NADH:ubiquinone oxidoreductase subunit E
MAWIVKNSAGARIETRREPYLTAKMIEHYKAVILPRYATTMGALMPILHDVQEHYGYTPYQAMIEIANLLSIKPSDVLDTCTFYEEFRTKPLGKYIVGVCQSIACEVCGHQAIVDHLREKYDIEPSHGGETTEDGRFTLMTLECLGSCDTAPVALVNDDLHEGLTIEKLDDVLDNLP